MRFAGLPLAWPRPERFAALVSWWSDESRGSKLPGTKVSCEDCYFKRNMLCALPLKEPCSTFRPNHPEGLRPPSQQRFVFRQERRRQSAWAFPTAQEQAALHA
jgi:hypothetical protein